jgi:hypothetical protein
MSRVLRTAAILIALAAFLDPVFAVRRHTPLPIDVVITPDGEPGHDEALRLRDSTLTALGDAVDAASGEQAQAVLAIGNPRVGDVGGARVFVLGAPASAHVEPVSSDPVDIAWGQETVVSAAFRAQQMRGRTTTFKLTAAGGATLAMVQHRWEEDDDRYVPAFAFAPSAPGQSVLRVVAESDGAPASAVDVAVRTSDRQVKVFVFEPRPSWTAGFARQALESDPLFAVRAVARTSRGVSTQSVGAPASLSALDLESVDVILAGGLEALTDADLNALRDFAAVRGGVVVLAPDGRIDERVRRTFELPSASDALLEKPIDLAFGRLKVRASEMLRTQAADRTYEAVIAVSAGRGQVMMSAGLDAWRYRADSTRGFERYWRALIAEAAARVVPSAALRLEPVVARPGDEVTLRVTLRSVSKGPFEAGLPKATASLIGAEGPGSNVRLWPGTRADEYVGVFPAPVAAGRYDVRVDLDGLPRQDALLIVKPDAARPAVDRSRELAFLTEATGGAVIADGDVPSLVEKMRALSAAQQLRDVRPTRSAWWMLAFVACAGSEWAIRRARGQR